jgi:hypothetical protein
MRTTLEQRFDEKWTPEPNVGCWLWTGATFRDGYGAIQNGERLERAHRVSWLLRFGDPGKLHVLHRCDVRACVNPAHLWLGTRFDNMRDMVAKGRANTPRGSSSGAAKLTEGKVAEMRRLYDSGLWRQADLAVRYGVTTARVSKIIRRESWRHVGSEVES